VGASSVGMMISGVHELDDLFSHIDDLPLLEFGHAFYLRDGYSLG